MLIRVYVLLVVRVYLFHATAYALPESPANSTCSSSLDNQARAGALQQDFGPEGDTPEALSLLSQRARQKQAPPRIYTRPYVRPTRSTLPRPVIVVQGGVFSGFPEDYLNLGCAWRGEIGGDLTIAFEARFFSIPNDVKVIDWAENGELNIMIGADGSGTRMHFVTVAKDRNFTLKVENAIEIGVLHRYLFSVSLNGRALAMRDGNVLAVDVHAVAPERARRKDMYVAKSQFGAGNFEGVISNLHVWEQVVTWNAAYPSSLSCTDPERFKNNMIPDPLESPETESSVPDGPFATPGFSQAFPKTHLPRSPPPSGSAKEVSETLQSIESETRQITPKYIKAQWLAKNGWGPGKAWALLLTLFFVFATLIMQFMLCVLWFNRGDGPCNFGEDEYIMKSDGVPMEYDSAMNDRTVIRGSDGMDMGTITGTSDFQHMNEDRTSHFPHTSEDQRYVSTRTATRKAVTISSTQ